MATTKKTTAKRRTTKKTAAKKTAAKKTAAKKTAAKKTAAKKARYIELERPLKLKNSRGTTTIITHIASQKNTGAKKKFDEKFSALPPGKRISADGNVYYERRQNRSDKSRKDKI